MAIGDVETQNDWLDAVLGPNRAAFLPASYDIEPWCGDPRDDDSTIASEDGVDLVAVSWDSDDWEDAVGGSKQTTAAVEWVLTVGLDDAVTHYRAVHPTSGLRAFSFPLASKEFPLGAGTLSIRPTVPWDDEE